MSSIGGNHSSDRKVNCRSQSRDCLGPRYSWSSVWDQNSRLYPTTTDVGLSLSTDVDLKEGKRILKESKDKKKRKRKRRETAMVTSANFKNYVNLQTCTTDCNRNGLRMVRPVVYPANVCHSRLRNMTIMLLPHVHGSSPTKSQKYVLGWATVFTFLCLFLFRSLFHLTILLHQNKKYLHIH